MDNNKFYHNNYNTQFNNKKEQFKEVSVGEFFDFTVNLKKNNNKNRKCLNCGCTSEEFLSTGFLGCPQCYTYLASSVSPVIVRLFGKSEHNGINYNIKPKGNKELLKEQLNQSVANEDYEQAVIIKRKLNALDGDRYE